MEFYVANESVAYEKSAEIANALRTKFKQNNSLLSSEVKAPFYFEKSVVPYRC
jgi:N-acetylmuramoyl-L-alanine amidase